MPRCAASTAVTAILALVAAGCAAPAPVSRAAKPTLLVVVAENFWGSIVAQLAGRTASVTTIVSDPNADPHSYQSSSDDARAFAGADYVVVNGAGYDAWADKLLSGNPSSKRTVLDVAGLLRKRAGDNPHFWYDPDYVAQVTDQIETDLKRLDAADSAYFDTQRAAFDAAMAPVRTRLQEIKSGFRGAPVAATESIFVYLAQYLGLDLISPPEFMQAVAEGNDPPAASVGEFQSQIRLKHVRALVYNQQTATVVTTNILKLAASARIPTIGVTETMAPPGTTFERWFGGELQSLEQGLAATSVATTSQP